MQFMVSCKVPRPSDRSNYEVTPLQDGKRLRRRATFAARQAGDAPGQAPRGARRAGQFCGADGWAAAHPRPSRARPRSIRAACRASKTCRPRRPKSGRRHARLSVSNRSDSNLRVADPEHGLGLASPDADAALSGCARREPLPDGPDAAGRRPSPTCRIGGINFTSVGIHVQQLLRETPPQLHVASLNHRDLVSTGPLRADHWFGISHVHSNPSASEPAAACRSRRCTMRMACWWASATQQKPDGAGQVADPAGLRLPSSSAAGSAGCVIANRLVGPTPAVARSH